MLTTATDLWALRYPANNELYLLDRRSERGRGGRPLDARTNRIRARSDHLAARSSVIVASEPMDQDDRWRPLEPGAMVHVGPGLSIDESHPLTTAPRHSLRLGDLDVDSATSQLPPISA